MNPALLVSVLSALAAAVWSVWTWREEQEKERQLRRDQEAALFVNSFIQATEELQSRLYGILQGDDLVFYKKEYPEQYGFGSPFAIEILYRLSKFFGWTYRIFRYGSYTNDPTVIELIRRIGEALESHTQFPGNAFRFTYEERVALGDAVVRRTGDIIGTIPVFESITVFQFFEMMSDESSKYAYLFQTWSVRRTLAAINESDQAVELEGVERLAVLQNYLVDLLTYLEDMEGFSVSPGKRRKVRLRGIVAEALPLLASDATVVHQTPGRIRLRVPRLRTDEMYAPLLESLLDSMDNITSIRISVSAASVVIGFTPEIPGMEFAKRIKNIIETGFPGETV